jgi:hypothetical protein
MGVTSAVIEPLNMKKSRCAALSRFGGDHIPGPPAGQGVANEQRSSNKLLFMMPH